MESDREMNRKMLAVIQVLILAMTLFGCGFGEDAMKYRVIFDDSTFETERTLYSPGEEVTVRYDMIATDTDYSFYSDDVDLKVDFDGGYVLSFVMPEHDVTLRVESRNTMEYDPDAHKAEEPTSPLDYISDENMLFDYYEATVATVGGDEHKEYVLYRYDESRLILALYQKIEDEEETMDYCMVPESVLDKCMKLVEQNKMSEWQKGSGIDGKKLVVKFVDNGTLKRISSDDMPEDGEKAFEGIREILDTEWADGTYETLSGTWFCPECGTKNDGRYCSGCGLARPE